MADNTIIQQGSFVSTGTATTLQLRSDIDWMRLVNYTEAAAANNGHGCEYYWQRGLAANDGFVYIRPAASQALGLETSAALAVPGFTLVNSTVTTPGNPVAITAVSTAGVPVVSTGTTTGLSAGSIVRLNNVAGAPQLGGIDYTIGTVVAATSFTLPNMAQLAVAGTTGFYSIIPFNPIFYPARRTITSIVASQVAATFNLGVVTMSVNHGYTVGQQVRFVVPAAYGMTQMDGLLGTIIATTSGTIIVNIDVSTFTAFAFPLAGAVPFTYAEVVPVGEAAAVPYANLLDDATLNTGYIGMLLGAGITSPAGSISDVIYWTAGKSFSNNGN